MFYRPSRSMLNTSRQVLELAGGPLVIVGVCHLIVLAKLALRISIVVGMVDRSVVVLVDMVMRAMVEHTGDLSGFVLMGNVPVVVHVS
jgi:hypothetical protein